MGSGVVNGQRILQPFALQALHRQCRRVLAGRQGYRQEDKIKYSFHIFIKLVKFHKGEEMVSITLPQTDKFPKKVPAPRRQQVVRSLSNGRPRTPADEP